MYMKYFYDKALAQASYMVGCQACGEALVIDPARDISPYLEAASAEGLHIAHVTETHIHADFVSGVRELAAATGARIYLSGMGGDDWQYTYPHDATLRDGDVFMVGNVKVQVIHTPGHTPEHISFLITDTKSTDMPYAIATGDTLFVGDIGRPDLLEVAVGVVGSKEVGARQQFHTLRKLSPIEDFVMVLPGHGAGSACGKALGALPSTTLGYERRVNPAFRFESESEFVSWLNSDQPDAPRYFAQMKKVNKEGARLVRELSVPVRMNHATLLSTVKKGTLVVDLRDAAEYAHAYIPGTLSIPASSTGFINYIGLFVDYNAPFYFIVPSESDVPYVLTALRSIGIDNVPGYFTADDLKSDTVKGDTKTMYRMTARELAMVLEKVTVLDVRNQSEYAERHIQGAVHIPLGQLPKRAAELPKDRLIAVHCASGYRSGIAATLLQNLGFNVANMNEPDSVWKDTLPTE
jgi:hydroxyacylglutathione hydrolase